MVNFSDGGMLLATDIRLRSGGRVILEFLLDSLETVEGVVLRTKKATFGSHQFTAAIEFSSADREQKERFYRFITKTQMERANALKS